MSDSTSLFLERFLSATQGSKEAKANMLIDCASPAMWFGLDPIGSAGLTLKGFGGTIYIDGARSTVANWSISLQNNTNCVQVSRAGTVNRNTSTFEADKLPLWKIVCASGFITSIEDHRDLRLMDRFYSSHATQAMADANQTLTAEQVLCSTIEATGALTALRDLIVPAVRRTYIVFANVTGGFGVRVKTSGGTGITVADAKWATLHCDGTNVVRVTADT